MQYHWQIRARFVIISLALMVVTCALGRSVLGASGVCGHIPSYFRYSSNTGWGITTFCASDSSCYEYEAYFQGTFDPVQIYCNSSTSYENYCFSVTTESSVDILTTIFDCSWGFCNWNMPLSSTWQHGLIRTEKWSVNTCDNS